MSHIGNLLVYPAIDFLVNNGLIEPRERVFSDQCYLDFRPSGSTTKQPSLESVHLLGVRRSRVGPRADKHGPGVLLSTFLRPSAFAENVDSVAHPGCLDRHDQPRHSVDVDVPGGHPWSGVPRTNVGLYGLFQGCPVDRCRAKQGAFGGCTHHQVAGTLTVPSSTLGHSVGEAKDCPRDVERGRTTTQVQGPFPLQP